LLFSGLLTGLLQCFLLGFGSRLCSFLRLFLASFFRLLRLGHLFFDSGFGLGSLFHSSVLGLLGLLDERLLFLLSKLHHGSVIRAILACPSLIAQASMGLLAADSMRTTSFNGAVAGLAAGARPAEHTVTTTELRRVGAGTVTTAVERLAVLHLAQGSTEAEFAVALLLDLRASPITRACCFLATVFLSTTFALVTNVALADAVETALAVSVAVFRVTQLHTAELAAPATIALAELGVAETVSTACSVLTTVRDVAVVALPAWVA